MSEVMDWHKRATAVSNALYAEGDRRRLGAYSGFMYGVCSALTWASEQEPTEAEVQEKTIASSSSSGSSSAAASRRRGSSASSCSRPSRAKNLRQCASV